MRGKCFVSNSYLRFAAGFLVGLVAVVSRAAETPSAPAPASEKAMKYYSILVARPEPGYLFDRFYNTWLDDSTVDSLEGFLRKQVETSQKTPDRLLLAFFYAKKGDDVAALEAFRKALEHNPASAATWYHKALVEARTLDFDGAIADLKKAREQKPDEKLAILIDKQLGKLYARNRQTAEALKVWQTLLLANWADEELSEDVVELLIEEGLLKEAAAFEEKLVARTKDQYLAVTRRLRLGDIYHRAGDRAKAIAAYTTALDAVGSESWLEREILAQLDQVYRREDDLSGLKRLYGDLLKKYEKRIAIQRRFAQLLVELGEQEPAIAAYREILKLTPGDRATREEFIGVLAKLGKQDEAIKELQSLSEQHAKDAELCFRLASLYQEAKKPDQTISAVDRYLETSDGSEYAYLRAARLLERLDNKEAAVHIYEKMAQKFADSAAAQEAYASFLYSAGKKKEAIERWGNLAKGGDVAQMLQVARTLTARNENEAAFELLKGGLAKVKNDPLYLGQLVTTALALKKYDEAIPWAEERVRLADQTADLETAVDQAATAIERADKLEAEAHRLEAVEQRGVPETCLLAELLERTGNSDRADAALKTAADKGSLLAISEQIRLFSDRREWNAAAAATRKMLEVPGGRKSLHVRRLVELYQRDFQLEEGLKWIDEWKRLSPGSTTPWVTEVRMLQGLGRNDEALKVLRTAVLKFDQDEDLRVRLAEFYTETEKPADAMRIYWQLYEETEDLNGKLRWAQKLGELAQQQGTVQQLVQDFDERVRTNRQSIVPLLALSEIYRVTDDYEGRRRALTAAAKIKPDDIYLLQQIARVEEQDGDWRSAISTLERAAPLDKTNRTRELIAQLHLSYGNEETGFAMLFELAGAANADPRTLETTADTLCGMHEWERAADFLQRRITEHPADYRLRYLLAVALEEAGRTAESTQQFLQLLSDQEELPTKKKTSAPTQAQQMSSYYDFIRQLMPPEAFEWFQLAQYRYTAYTYRQQQGYAVVRAAVSGAPRSAVQVPTSVDNIRPLAITHLLSIGATLEDDKLSDLCKELESRGIKQAKVLTRLDSTRPDFGAILPDLLEKDPNNETALAILVVQQMGVRDDALGPYCIKALEKFRQPRPQLAFMAAMQAGVTESKNDAGDNDGQGAKPNKYLDEALKIAGTFDHPNPMIVMSLTMVLGGRNIGGQDVQIGETYRRKFSELLVKWYPEISKSPQLGSWAYYSASQSLAKNSDPTAYVQFLDDEVSRWHDGAKGPNARNQIAQMMGSGRQPQLLPQASYPPRQLSDFPPHVLASFATNQNDAYSPFGGQEATIDEDAAKKITPLLDKIKSPVLRILFARKAELNDRVDAELKKLLSAKTPILDAFLLAASIAGEKDQPAEVVRLLQKSQYLPMKQEMRRQVDASLVAAVLAAKDKSKELDPEILDAGQKASLRLRRSRLDPQQRTELIAAMETLGLKKEAEKLDAQAAASGTQRSPSGPVAVYGGAVATRTSTDQIAKLIEQGKRDVAAKQLAAEVSAQARQMMSNPQNMSYYRQMSRQVRQRVDAHGLADDVLKSLEPGDSKNVQKITEYAMACQIFDRKQPARAALEHALEIRPKEDMARMQLILLAAADDPQAASKQLAQISKIGRAAFGQMLSEQMQDYETPFEQRLGFARLTIDFLKTLEPGDLAQSYWIDNMMNSVGRQMSGRRGSLPSLYAVNPRDRSQYQNQPELMAERRKVHDEICQQMLKVPELARTGFRYLLAATEAQEKPVDDFAAHAERILTAEADAKPNRPSVRQTAYYNSSEAEVRFRTPEEFLARRAWKSNDWKLIDETLLPKLSGAKNREARERLTQLATLYRCEEGQFLGEAEKIVRQFKPAQPGQANEGMAIAVDVWTDRGLNGDLQPLVLKQLKLDAAGQNAYQPPGYLVRYMEGIAKKLPHASQLAFLDEVATIYIGPAEKRNDFIKKNYDRHRIQWGTPNGRIYVYGQLMEQLCQRSDLMFTVLEHLEQYDEPKPVNNYEYRVREVITQLQSKGPEATMEMLKRSPWLQDLKNFRSLVIGNNNNSNSTSPFSALLRVNAKAADFHKKLRELVEAQQLADGKTFGGGLVLAALDQEKSPNAVLDYVGGQIEAIRALPEKQQQDLAALVRDLTKRDANAQKNLSASAKAAQEWTTGSSAGQAQTMLSRLEKAKRLTDVGISEGQVDDFLRQNMAEMIRSDLPAAIKAFMRLCELSREAQRRGEWHMYMGDGASLEGYLLNQVGYSVRPIDWPLFIFATDAINNGSKKPVEASNIVSYIGTNAIQASLGRAPKLPNGNVAPIQDRIRTLYEELGKALDGRPGSLIIGPFYNQLQGELKNKSVNDKVREWTAKEMSGGKYPELAADLNAVASLIDAERMAGNGAKRDPKARREMADYHKRFCALMRDEKLPIGWRIYIASFLAQREPATLPLEAAKDIATLYTQALDKGVPLVSEQNRVMTRAVLSFAHDSDMDAMLNEWRATWSRRYLGQQARQQNRPNQFEQLNKLTDADALCSALQVYLAVEGPQMPEGATRLLSVYDDYIGSLPQVLAVLVRAHQPEEAARLLRRGAPKLVVSWPNSDATRYDDEIEKLLPPMLEKLERDDERYLVKVLFAAMPDGEKPKQNGPTSAGVETPRDERLSKLAGEFASVDFKDPSLKKLSLVLLSGSDAAGKQVAGDIAAAYEASSILSALGGNNQTRLTQETRLAECHFRNLLRDGKYEAYVDLLKRMSANPRDDDYQFGNAVSPFIDCAVAALRDTKRKPWSVEACGAIGEALGGALKGREYVNINNFENFGTVLVALYCQADKPDKLSDLKKSLSEYSRNRLDGSGVGQDVWRFGLSLNGTATPDNLDARIRYLQNVLRCAFEQKWLQRNSVPYRMRGQGQNDRNFLTAVVKVGLLSSDELKTHGLKAFEGIGPNDEKTYAKAVFANWLQSGKDYEKAAEVWRSMISIQPDAKKVARNEANYVLGLAVCLKNLQRYDEALSTLAKLEGKDFDQALKGSYDQYKREIEAAKADANKNSKGDKPSINKSTHSIPNRPQRILAKLATLQLSTAV